MIVRNLADAPDPFDADVETSVLSMDVDSLELPGSPQTFKFTNRVVWQIQSPWTGFVVRTLVSDQPITQPGSHSVTLAWDGRSEQGVALPDGVYRYQVRVDLVRTHKSNSNNQHNLDTVLSPDYSTTLSRQEPILGPTDQPLQGLESPPVPDLTKPPPGPGPDSDLKPPAEEPTINPVGRIEGSLSVTPAGTAQYVIPLQVPPGRQGLQPDLELVYESNQREGHLGVGWSLRGLSVIQRCGKTPAYDDQLMSVRYQNLNDRYCLDGTRLIAVTGPNGGNGTVYVTKRESFRKVVSFGAGPDYFEVHTKDGRILTYGCDGSTLESGERGDCSARMYARHDVPFAWALRQVRDRKKNYLRATYWRIPSTADEDWDGDGVPDYTGRPETAEFMPRSILYTGYSGHSRSDARDPDRGVYFDYLIPGLNLGHSRGIRAMVANRLMSIRTFVKNQPVLQYFLKYEKSQSTGRMLMRKVTLCDRNQACLPPTYFGWSESNNDTSSTWEADETLIPASDEWSAIAAMSVVDLNGDGFDDLVYVRDNSWRVLLSTGNSAAPFSDEMDTGIAASMARSADGRLEWVDRAFALDLDNDGLGDLVVQEDGLDHFRAYRWDGVSFDEVLDLTEGAGPRELRDNTARIFKLHRYAFFGDVTGDGLADYLFCPVVESRPEASAWIYRINLGNGRFGQENVTPYGCNGDRAPDFENPPFLLDMDGDGALELFDFSSGSSAPRFGEPVTREWNAIQFTGAVPAIHFNLFLEGKGTAVVDVNGDGLADVVQHPGVEPNDPSVYHYLQVWLNTGSGSTGSAFIGGRSGLNGGYLDLEAFAEPSFHPSSLPHYPVADFDQDGRQDLVVVDPWWRWWGVHEFIGDYCPDLEVDAYLMKGTDELRDFVGNAAGKRSLIWPGAPLTSAPICNRNSLRRGAYHTTADIDGDGRPDVVMTAGDRLRVRFHGGGQEDLMTGVRDGLIGMSPTSPDWPDWSTRFTHRVEYRPSSDPEVYARGYVTSETPPPCSYPTACGLPKGVLAFRAQSYNGEGNPPASVKYSYHDSRFDRHGLGWLGFGQVVEEDERSGAVMVRTYDQTRDPTTRMYPFLGSLVSAWSYVQSVQGGPYLVEQATFVNALKELGAWMQGKSFLPYLQQHSIKYYEIASPEPGPGDLPLQTRDLSVVIDRFGNPTLLEIKAGDGSSTRVELNYKTNTSQWILGQPWWLNVMNTTAGGESARRSVNYAHYNDGFLVKSQRFVHQDSAQRLTLEYAWDKYGNVTTETAISETGERRSTQVAYDTEGLFPTTVLNAAGHQVRLAYNVRFGGLAVYESPNLAKHQWAFDGLGRLAKHVLPTSAEVRHRYGSEPDGAISFPWQSQEVAGVILERTVFDSAGRPTRRETPGLHGSTNAERLVYHQNGQLGLRTVPYDVGNGPTTTGTRYEYDLAGRLTEIGLPDQNRWFYVYDGNTRRTYYNNKISGLRQSVATDDLGDIIEVRDAAGNPTTYRYGPFGHLAFIDGPGGPVLSRSVDAYGFTRSLKDANAGSQEYQYNSFGELWKVIDATGAVWEMAVGVKVVVA